jgi:hypothetical protein
MRTFLIAGVAAILVSAANLASAQQPPSPTQPPTAGAEESKGRSPGVQNKRQACRRDGQAKGSRGPDLQDYVAVCVAEARLGCLKQAVEQKVRGQARREFIGKCLST